jgi:hypothetical protein
MSEDLWRSISRRIFIRFDDSLSLFFMNTYAGEPHCVVRKPLPSRQLLRPKSTQKVGREREKSFSAYIYPCSSMITNNNDVHILIEHEVLQFNISMNDLCTMHMINSGYDLSDILSCFIFIELFSR